MAHPPITHFRITPDLTTPVIQIPDKIDLSLFDYSIKDDLTVELTICGVKITPVGDDRDRMLTMMESLLKEFEAKALKLDIQEGHYG